MAVLSNYFSEALTNIEPTEDTANAITAHSEVSKVLNESDELKALGISPILIGSYAREVSIKRIKDVDVFGRLEDAGDDLEPGDALDLFEKVLTDGFGEDRVERQARSIKVEFSDFDLSVDAVPARRFGENWELPNHPIEDEKAEWVETNPLRMSELTTGTNQAYVLNGNGIYVPVVKLIRQTRRNWLGDHPGGFFFEVLTHWAFNNQTLVGSSVAEYVTLALEEIAAMLPDVAANGLDDATIDGKKISTKASAEDMQEAITKISQAAALARDALDDDDNCSSALKWRELFGKTSDDEFVFPIPEYCNTDGTHKSSVARLIVPGAATVPAGDGRYA
tara:strand:+ start:9776 stop:10783 length:1008 start_codon:yes stop_codon:yes gene_type:complete